MLPSLFFIIGVLMVYMIFFVAGNEALGAARPILSIAFFALFILFLFEALEIRRRGIDETEEEERGAPRRRTRG